MNSLLALPLAHPSDHLHVIDLPYRLSSWALDEPANLRLWHAADGSLLGWAALQTPFWTFDLYCRPDAFLHLYPQMLEWACRRAQQALDTPFGHPCWFVNIFEDQPEHIQALEQAGFADQQDFGEDSWSIVWMERSGGLPVADYRIPPGFTVRPLAGESELEAYVELHRSVFETTAMTVEWRRRTLQQPAYCPELDLVVADPQGNLAAFCVAWLAEIEGEPRGQIEPLGCHPAYRQYALGRLALAEALRRLIRLRAVKIHVDTDNYRNTARLLYEHMDFRVTRRGLVFRKDFAIQ